MSLEPAAVTDILLRLLYDEVRPLGHELSRPEVVDRLRVLVRALAVLAARGGVETPEQVVRRVLRETAAAPPRRAAPTAEEQARAVRRIRQMLRTGKSPDTVAAALNAAGVPAPHGRRWHRRSVQAAAEDRGDDDDDSPQGPRLHIAG